MAAMALTEAEFGYQVNLQDIAMLEYAKEDYIMDYEVAAVGVGLGGGFENTGQLKPMKYDETMATDKAPHQFKQVTKRNKDPHHHMGLQTKVKW
eukprot:1239509-Ditylum_brightwellii.AAC.2